MVYLDGNSRQIPVASGDRLRSLNVKSAEIETCSFGCKLYEQSVFPLMDIQAKRNRERGRKLPTAWKRDARVMSQ